MATSTINGITLFSPDNPCMVFNPCMFTLSGTMARTRVRITSGGRQYETTYQTPNGGTLDLRQYLQTYFNDNTYGMNLSQINTIKVSELGKNVAITLFVQNEGTTLATFSKVIFCIWGGLAVDERFNEKTRHLTWFRNFPFTVGIYSNAQRTLNYDAYIVDPQDGVQVKSINVPSPGLYNIAIDEDGGVTSRHISIIDNAAPHTEHVNIKIDREHTEGVYLRWINRHGMWDYHLFKAGDQTLTAASRYGMWYRNQLNKYNIEDGWQGGSGRRQLFIRNDTLPVCAPLVDSETFDRLKDIATSPVVDMFLRWEQDEAFWTSVSVEPAQYTKDTDKPEQDFVINLLLPEIPVQTL